MRRRLPSLTSVRDFEAVARRLSFTKAAEELCVTQAAVSHQIKALEQELGTKLFLRGKPGIQLTPAGQRLLTAARNAFDGLATATSQIRRDSDPRMKRLRMRVPPLFSNVWLAPRLMKFMGLYPDVEFVLTHASAEPHHDLEALVKESGPETGDAYDGCTMTIVAESNTPHGLNSDCLFAADVVPLCNPKARTKAHCRDGVRTLCGEVLLCEMPHNTWPNWLSNAGASDISPLGRLYFNDPAVLVQVGAAGRGVFMGSPSLLRNYIRNGTLAMPLGEEIRVQRSYYLIYDEAVLQYASAAAFRSWLLSEVSIFKDQGPPRRPSRQSGLRRAAA